MTSIPRNTNWGTAAASIEQLVESARGAAVIEANNYTDEQVGNLAATVESLTGLDPTVVSNFIDLLEDFQDTQDATDTGVADAIENGTLTPAALDSRFPRVDLAPSGNSTTDIANLKAAATAALSAGRDVVYLAPGHYDFEDIAPEDIGMVKIAGEGVTVTGDSYVYPFTADDLAGTVQAAPVAGGRGRIAFEVDDGLSIHWSSLFRLCKRLGITMGTAWHTGNGAKWITEAHRHGWEIIAHLPQNITATEYRDNGELDAAAQASVAAIAAITGTSEGIGFVYPQHARDADTDRILSKYFTRGRGLSSTRPYPIGMPHPWLTTALSIDSHVVGGNLSDELRRLLREVAASDTGMVFYLHYNSDTEANYQAALPKLVQYARALGIQIVNPNQIWGSSVVSYDPYFEDTSLWTLGTGGAFDTEHVYHGTRSVKFTPGGTNFFGTVSANKAVRNPARPGMFTVYRASFRLYNPNPIPLVATSTGSGFYFSVAPRHRKRDGSAQTTATQTVCSRRIPEGGGQGELPAQSNPWTRYQELVYFPPNVEEFAPRLTAASIAPNTDPFWVDEFKFEHVDYVTEVRVPVTLNGTSNVVVFAPTPDVGSMPLDVSPADPAAPPAGQVTVTVGSAGQLTVTSTDAGDDMDIHVVIRPPSRGSFDTATLSSDGA